MEFFARCAGGFEPVLAVELKRLGARQVRPLSGGVSFSGGLEQGYRACLWCRVATRIQLVLARIGASDADELYGGAAAFPWEDHIPPGATIAVRAHGANQHLRNTRFTALKVKDAVCDRLRRVRGRRPDVDAADPGFAVDVALHRAKATLYLDLSGETLDRRGYRGPGARPGGTRATVAAGMLLFAGWEAIVQGERSSADRGGLPGNAPVLFVDPSCGNGAVAVEAAMVAADAAPGILRAKWGFEGWMHHDAGLWGRLIDEADDRLERGLQAPVRLVACDADASALDAARAGAKRAGVDRLLEFRACGPDRAGDGLAGLGLLPEGGLLAADLVRGGGTAASGGFPSSPGARGALEAALDALPQGWHAVVLAPDGSADTALGMLPERVLSCFDGPDQASMRFYGLSASERVKLQVVSLSGRERTVPVAERNSGQFASRLRKVAKERAKWARKAGVSCYRVYDSDLPDYAVAVDIYTEDGSGRKFVQVAEYLAPATVDGQRARRRFDDAMAIVPVVLDADPACVRAKTRRREKGGGQYRREGGDRMPVEVREGGFLFEVDLGGHLDTGLFLDHRQTRAMVGSMAQGKRFLNLFAYTGSASVYAAGGRAAQTVTVDMSQTYLAWARRNMERNGFAGGRHRFERADALAWLRRERQSERSYDLVFCDPPTFSNSKSMGARTWSVQRDHAELLGLVEGVLAPGGTIVFSCNLRNFKLDGEALAEHGLVAEDITARTIPHDFSRTPKIHRCYLVRRASEG